MNEWINIKDEQPKQGHWCIIYSWRGVLMASFWKSHWCIYQYNQPGIAINIDDVTHWMPAPTPPTEENTNVLTPFLRRNAIGHTEFRVVIDANMKGYVHVLSRDSETLDFEL